MFDHRRGCSKAFNVFGDLWNTCLNRGGPEAGIVFFNSHQIVDIKYRCGAMSPDQSDRLVLSQSHL